MMNHSAGTFDRTPKQKREISKANKKREAETRDAGKKMLTQVVLVAVGKSRNTPDK
jgi:hypothetical protein